VKRFFRDTGILLAFCGAFYVLILLVGGLDGETSSDANEFSPMRVSAEKFADKKDWGSAIKEFEKLTEADPQNGYAWKRLGLLILKTRRDALYEEGELDSNQLQSATATEISKRIENNTLRAINVMDELSKFARHRPYALLQLAVLETYRNNHDEALDHLEEFLGRGYMTDHGLGNYSSLGEGRENAVWIESRIPPNVRLHQYKRFWNLVRKERQSRGETDFHSMTPPQLLRFRRGSWGNLFRVRR
jgi:tetratricopeptide (TPR) repeat protein